MTDWVDQVRRFVPRPLRYQLQRWVSLDDVKRRWRQRAEPLSVIERSDPSVSDDGPCLAILRNRAQFHVAFVRACQEMSVAFRVLDLGAEDWLDKVSSSGCRAVLAWPDATSRPWAKLFKDRCDLIESELGMPVLPNRLERWLYEDKVRQHDWLKLKGLPHPDTWVFAEQHQALAFAATCPLPIVCKTSFGAAAAGVRMVHRRSRLRTLIRRVFAGGLVADGHDHRDRERGVILMQRFLDQVSEWRLVRIGDSYFGHPKGRVGAFHSGSGRVEWTMPEDRHLALLHDVTELGGFRSMAVDVFETPDGRLLINELQTVFGASTSIDQMKKDGVAGRMVRQGPSNWVFEAGDFARNACANLRVAEVIEQLGLVTPHSEVRAATSTGGEQCAP